MEIEQDDRRRCVYIWLTKKESEDQNLKTRLHW